MNDYSIEIASFPDKDFLVAEIWFRDKFIAEISQEEEEMVIEFFLNDGASIFTLAEFLEVVEKAKGGLQKTGTL